MGIQLKRERRRVATMVVLVTSGIVLVGFLTWLVIALITQKAELELVQTYRLPEFNDLNNEYDVSDGEFAIAIDGVVATGHGKLATDVNTDSADNQFEIRPTASTAKMILGLAVMQVKPFAPGEKGETLTIGQEDYNKYIWYVNNGGSNTRVEVGEEISEYDALMSVFLASSNNMADTLAIWAFGSLENYHNYAKQMLEKWGINNTMLSVDASGFDASTTSTAADLARIGQKVLEEPVLAEIVGTKSYTVPVADTLENTNKLLGQDGIVGIKTGYIGEASGYCLTTGYFIGKHIITTALMGAPSREASFVDSLNLVKKTQELVKEQTLVSAGDIVGYYNSWWTGPVKITADANLLGIGWNGAEVNTDLNMDGGTGVLRIKIGAGEYQIGVTAEEYAPEPSFGDRLGHLFGWQKEGETTMEDAAGDATETDEASAETPADEPAGATDLADNHNIFTNAPSSNCTIKYGALMLINPNFTVENEFIAARRGELISLATNYSITEGNPGNGDNLMDAEAATHINEMIKAYEAEYPGHTMQTFSCFRAVGTACGRLCAATGASDHHTGLTCDLVDTSYGASLDTSTYGAHPDWQWLRANSYKYGFIDRFPEAWAGGSMDEPLNVDENGSTGLFETWHYRYVGVAAATEIATGKYNNGAYDSLEHYLKARGMVTNLKAGLCD